MSLDSVGAGLVAGGGLILLLTFAWGDPGESFGEIERGRRERNAWMASRVSAVATAAGAVLLLIPSNAWAWSLLFTLATVAACYLALAAKIHAEYGNVLRNLRNAKSAGGVGDVYTETLLGLRHEQPNDPALMMLTMNATRQIDELIQRAEERASWRWALAHPTGARRQGMWMNEALARPTIRTAILLLLVAAGTFAVWHIADVDTLDPWMPNIVVGLVTLAFTITVVEWIVRRERTLGEAGRANVAYSILELALLKLMQAVGADYVATHTRKAIDFGWNPEEVIRRWIEDGDAIDTPRRDPGDGSDPFILLATFDFADTVRRVVATEHQILPNDLVAAMNQVVENAAQTRPRDNLLGYTGLQRQIWEAHQVLYAVRFLAQELRSRRPNEWEALYPSD